MMSKTEAAEPGAVASVRPLAAWLTELTSQHICISCGAFARDELILYFSPFYRNECDIKVPCDISVSEAQQLFQSNNRCFVAVLEYDNL